MVASVRELRAAVANASAERVVLAAGRYVLDAGPSLGGTACRSAAAEAEVALDAAASMSDPRLRAFRGRLPRVLSCTGWR